MAGVPAQRLELSRFVEFTRAEWSRLRAATPLPLTEPQLRALVGLNEPVSLDEVSDIYLPLSRLLNLYVAATRNLHAATATFLGTDTPRVPFVIGIAGAGDDHMKLLAPIAETFLDAGQVERLRQASTAAEVQQLLGRVQA